MPRKSKGFTLIEMLVVIGICAALLSLAAPKASEMMKSGRRNTAAMAVNCLVIGIGQYHFEMQEMPENLEALTKKQGQFGPWVTKDALKDEWNNNFNYSYDQDSRLFAVWSSGPDGANSSGSNVTEKFSGDDIGTISQY